MRKVKIIGGAVTKFGKHFDRNMKSLVAEAVLDALKDAGISNCKEPGWEMPPRVCSTAKSP
jgi:acetyl-CoA acetyltransferase